MTVNHKFDDKIHHMKNWRPTSTSTKWIQWEYFKMCVKPPLDPRACQSIKVENWSKISRKTGKYALEDNGQWTASINNNQNITANNATFQIYYKELLLMKSSQLLFDEIFASAQIFKMFRKSKGSENHNKWKQVSYHQHTHTHVHDDACNEQPITPMNSAQLPHRRLKWCTVLLHSWMGQLRTENEDHCYW